MRVSRHVVEARQRQLTDLLKENRYLPVAELCRILNVSEATMRRDLTHLEKSGVLTRTHGGALGEYDTNFTPLSEREQRQQKEKQIIASLALPLIKPQNTLFLDAGTTTLAIARACADSLDFALNVVTNSVAAARILGNNPSLSVYLTGGRFLNRQEVLLGELAVESLRHWQFDLAFLGAEGMTAEGVWNSRQEVVSFQQAVMAQSRKKLICLDSSKLGHRTQHLLGSWENFDQLLTDTHLVQFKESSFPLKPGQILTP